MEEVSVFAFTGYRDFLKAWFIANGKTRGLQSKMCQAIGCQSAHLSRVLQEKVQLTMDQSFLACSFLNLNKSESEYFMKLSEFDRAGNTLYRQKLKIELNQLKASNENLSKRFEENQIGDPLKEMTYYSSWHWIAIHYLTAITSFQTTEQIAIRLGLNNNFVRDSLETLESFGLIKKEAKSWVLNTGSVHLPKSSPFNSIQHGNWRNRAVLKSQDIKDDGLHYTVVQTLSNEDFDKIKHLFLKCIDDYKKIANPSKSEDLTCFTIDFFRA